ncbi:MAG: RNA polymerase sigma factor [Bacteroidota bacterium]
MEDTLATPTAMAADKNKTLTESIKAYSRRLLGFIKQRVSSNEDAEDILQDVFYQFAGNPEPVEQVASWLFTVARNKITDRYRKHQLPLIDDLQPASADDDETFDWKDMVPAAGDSPETVYLRNLFWEELQQALDELPPEQRDAFIQNEMESISFKDISQASGVSVATLISRKRYAVLYLRERLQGLKEELLNY